MSLVFIYCAYRLFTRWFVFVFDGPELILSNFLGKEVGRYIREDVEVLRWTPLWAAFLIVDEAFIAFAVEATHFRLFIATLVTVLVMELLPE